MEAKQKTAFKTRAKTGGRKPGVKNKKTSSMREKARPYADKAIDVVYKLMKETDNHQVKLACCKELIDRGYGRPQVLIEKTIEKTVEHVSDTDVARRAAFLLHKAGLDTNKPETQH